MSRMGPQIVRDRSTNVPDTMAESKVISPNIASTTKDDKGIPIMT
jgi:hypothetical protein